MASHQCLLPRRLWCDGSRIEATSVFSNFSINRGSRICFTPALLISHREEMKKFRVHAEYDSQPNQQTFSKKGPFKQSLPLLSQISPVRALSVVRLLRIDQGGAFADVLAGEGDDAWADELLYLQRTLGFRTVPLDARHFRQVTDTVGGCVRWRRYLDYVILDFFNGGPREFDRMEPLLLQALRLGVFEILMTDKPAHVINETVELVKAALRPGAANLSNAILRKILDAKVRNSIPSPRIEGDDRSRARAISTLHSHPVWFVRRCIKRFGEAETIKLLQFNNARPSFSLRANKLKGVTREALAAMLDDLEVSHEDSPYLPEFVRIQSGMQAVLKAGMLSDATCTVQDESAGLVVSLLDPQPGETLIDCCAAPGGKTLFAAAKMDATGRIFAIDLNKGRVRMVREAADKHNLKEMVVTQTVDLREFAESFGEKVDRVLLDAPCSGLGVLSKRADLRWRRSPESIAELCILQRELLESAAKLVRPGGILVYSTCSIESEENEQQIESFLERHPEFEVQSAEGLVPESMVSEKGFFASLPQRDGIDGAFGAKLRLKLAS